MAAINRTLLGNVGFAVTEEEYVRAVAQLGAGGTADAIRVPSPNTAGGYDLAFTPFRWSFKRFREGIYNSPDPEALRTLSRMWELYQRNNIKRLWVETEGVANDSPKLVDVVRILRHPATGLASVAVDLPTPKADEKWQWPLRIAAFPDDFAQLDLEKLRTSYPARTLAELHETSRERPRAEVLVIASDVGEALERVRAQPFPVRAGYCVLFTSAEPVWSDLHGDLEQLLAETQAGGISLIAPPATGTSEVAAINRWIENLSHNETFDLALAEPFPADRAVHLLNTSLVERSGLTTAAKRLGPRLRYLATDATFTLPGDAFTALKWRNGGKLAELAGELELGDLSFQGESHGATAISRIAEGERDARREAARTATPRYLQGDVFWLGDEKAVTGDAGLVVGRQYRFVVYIAPEKQASLAAGDPFRDDLLDWGKEDSYTLDVVFTEPRQWPSWAPTKTLTLRRYGSSTKCAFDFKPAHAGPFAGRVTVMHRGRILQTAILSCEVYDTPNAPKIAERKITLDLEAIVRRNLGTLDDRRWFDACLVLNHTSAQKAAMTAAAKGEAFVTSLEKLDSQLKDINALLNRVALDHKPYHKGLTSPENTALLVALAKHGRTLYDVLVTDQSNNAAAEAIKNAEYLQIVSTKADALVPLEFVYRYPWPKNDAKVCPNAVGALKVGRCPANCVPKDSPAEHVCPLGFWGLSKVIERHVHIDPRLLYGAAATIVPVPESEAGHEALLLKGTALLATSTRVDEGGGKRKKTDPKPSEKLLDDVRRAWGQTVDPVLKWKQWKSNVAAAPPVLIIALPHTDGTGINISLEIGGEEMAGGAVDHTYVRPDPAKPPPIALLLGCDIVNAAHTDAYTSHVAVFRRAQAALVLGTVATVFGEDSADMAGRLFGHLVNAVKAKPGRFGEVLRLAKCEAVADSLMIALCLVAFGDADWRLEMEGP